ncbi:hypothetical protein MTO96_049302 [Rhipicephalus appendiculatus]
MVECRESRNAETSWTTRTGGFTTPICTRARTGATCASTTGSTAWNSAPTRACRTNSSGTTGVPKEHTVRRVDRDVVDCDDEQLQHEGHEPPCIN